LDTIRGKKFGHKQLRSIGKSDGEVDSDTSSRLQDGNGKKGVNTRRRRREGIKEERNERFE
jgi:hypothetical protein